MSEMGVRPDCLDIIAWSWIQQTLTVYADDVLVNNKLNQQVILMSS